MKIQNLNKNLLNQIHFRVGSNQAGIFDLVYLQDKTEDEAAKSLKMKVGEFNFYLSKVNKKLKDFSGLISQPQLVAETPVVLVGTEASPEKVLDMRSFVPLSDGYIPRKYGKTTDVKILEKCYNDKSFVLIMGETGCGKTHLIRHFAFVNKLPYVRINLNGGTTADELIGHWVPKPAGGFRWQDGVLTAFARNGGIVALDEVNACPAEILFALHSLTDDERTLTLTSKDGEVIRANPNFFLVATMNPDYEGTRPLNAAFKDRFKVKLYFDYDAKIENELVKNPELLKLANKLRIMKTKGELNTPISTRLLLYYNSNVELFGKNLATEFFLNNFEPYEREPIKNVIEMISSGNDVSSQSEVI